MKLRSFVPYLPLILMGVVFLQPFHTQKLYPFESETSRGVAGLLFFHEQLVDTISLDKLQTNATSAVYIEFAKFTHEPPYDWDAVYGAEGNYRVYHNGQKIPESQLPYVNEFSSPRLLDDSIIYWGFIEGKAYGFRTDLHTLSSDSVLLFNDIIASDFRYTYDFPTPGKDGAFLFRTLAVTIDSVMVNFEEHTVTKVN